ncbi:MAG: SCO family protein [Streptosporangiaceae bacterium]|nr:SCO family protein [Streptosporangiaceae bacterium]MBV9856902.1 SCO family protein [Streptosporangiaceae bacterium]
MIARNVTSRARAGRAGAAVLAAALLAVLAALSGCASSTPSSPGPGSMAAGSADMAGGAAAQANPNLDTGTSLGGHPAPDIRLANQFGQPMSLTEFRGKVVILAFTDSQCTTICPLTTQSMVLARELLGKAAASVRLLGVDANPEATSVADVLAYSRAHGMVNQWDFLTGTDAQLKAVWSAYHIVAQIDRGQIDHTPALYVIDQRGREQKVYLTTMAYSSVGQAAQVLAQEVSSLLPGHPKLASEQSLAAIQAEAPTMKVSLPAVTGAGKVAFGPGSARLVVFFATWLSEISGLKSHLTGLNAYVQAARRRHLPPLAAVDETVTEPSAQAARGYLGGIGALSYPVALDETGRVADGYGVQDQPWLVLVSAKGKVIWSHDGWVPLSLLEAAAAARA